MRKRAWSLCAIVSIGLLLLSGASAGGADPMDVARTILNDPQMIFWEDAAMMNDSGGRYFGDVAEKRLSDDGEYYEFHSDDGGAYMIGNLNFLDAGTFRGNAQALLFRFQAENPDDVTFMLYGPGEITLTFQEGKPIFTHCQDQYSAPYSQYRPTDLTVVGNEPYWVLMALDANGYYRSLIWTDRNTDDVAYCGENMGDRHSEYQGGNWHWTIAFGPNQTLKLQEYDVMDFEGFTDVDDSGREQDDPNGQPNDADPMETVNELVTEPNVLYADDLGSLPEHGYAYYSEVANKNPGDGFEFDTDDGNDGFTFLTPLNDVEPEGSRKDNLSQGVLLCFKTNNPTGLALNLTAQDTVYVTFTDGGKPALGIRGLPEIGLLPFEEQASGGFTLQADTWYYALIVVDIKSNIRYRIWEYGNADNAAGFSGKLVTFCKDDGQRTRYWEQNWTFGVTIGHNARFHLQDFRVFDFDEIKDS